jgi:hypothetical protein
MIADVFNLAVMSIAFCHAAARLMVVRCAAAIGAMLTQGEMSWERMRWESQCQENISVLTRDI